MQTLRSRTPSWHQIWQTKQPKPFRHIPPPAVKSGTSQRGLGTHRNPLLLSLHSVGDFERVYPLKVQFDPSWSKGPSLSGPLVRPFLLYSLTLRVEARITKRPSWVLGHVKIPFCVLCFFFQVGFQPYLLTFHKPQTFPVADIIPYKETHNRHNLCSGRLKWVKSTRSNQPIYPCACHGMFNLIQMYQSDTLQ